MRKYLLTGSLVVIAVLFVVIKYWDHITNPWTRNGQVMANVIQITPRVTGPIVELPVRSNQFVMKGDLLFRIDPRTYKVSLVKAKANLDNTGFDLISLEKQIESAKASLDEARANVQKVNTTLKQAESQLYTDRREYERQKILLPKGSTSQKNVDKAKTTFEVSEQKYQGAEASLVKAQATVRQAEASLERARANLGQLGEDNAQLRAAIANLQQAELNLEFTEVRAPADGYVTNLLLRMGSNTVANNAVMALVDVSSYWIDAYFKETIVGKIKPGDKAAVTLMSYDNTKIEGYVESIGWGISQQDGSTGFQLLPNVNPTFEWIRLAQRIPVRIHLVNVPPEISLRVGATCSVLVKTGTAEKTD